MPGSRLSSAEKKLQKRWESGGEEAGVTLRSIEIEPAEGVVGLRGIESTSLRFDFPVSVLVGRNGSGKSTLLALAALAFNGDGYIGPGRAKPGYTFVDFYARTRNENDPLNFSIKWRYRGEDDLVIHRKSTKKWMHYERRPNKAVHFVGVSRIAAPVESSGHRREFSATQRWTESALTPKAIDYLSDILGRKYSSAEIWEGKRHSLPMAKTSAVYSGFNMGTGESALIEIISALEAVPEGSLVLIEEIELGIHPSALKRLAQILVAVALKRSLQIICTSHSEWFIDGLPRQSRILVRRGIDAHNCMTGVTTRVALSDLLGESKPELRIVCEDEFAQRILELSIGVSLRKRVQIVPMGSKAVLPTAARILLAESPKIPVLIVWDCDVTDKDIRGAFRSADMNPDDLPPAVGWARLPGLIDDGGDDVGPSRVVPPEEAVRTVVMEDADALSNAARLMAAEPGELMEALKQSSTGIEDHHGIFTRVAEKLAQDESLVLNSMMGQFVERHSDSALVALIEGMLGGVSTGTPAKSEIPVPV